MAQTKKADSKAPAFYLYSVLQTIQKTDYNLSCCIRDSVCTEWTGYNATRKESGKELWPNKNILNSATPGSIWFLFIPLLTPFPPVKLALNTSARWPQDSSPNMKGPLSVPGVVWLTLWEWCVRGRESERDTDVYIRDQICVPFTKAKKKEKAAADLWTPDKSRGHFPPAITWRRLVFSGKSVMEETYVRLCCARGAAASPPKVKRVNFVWPKFSLCRERFSA